MCFYKKMKRVEELVEIIENDNTTIDKSFVLAKEANELIKSCFEEIKICEKKLDDIISSTSASEEKK